LPLSHQRPIGSIGSPGSAGLPTQPNAWPKRYEAPEAPEPAIGHARSVRSTRARENPGELEGPEVPRPRRLNVDVLDARVRDVARAHAIEDRVGREDRDVEVTAPARGGHRAARHAAGDRAATRARRVERARVEARHERIVGHHDRGVVGARSRCVDRRRRSVGRDRLAAARSEQSAEERRRERSEDRPEGSHGAACSRSSPMLASGKFNF
jgi:hypothetical protein